MHDQTVGQDLQEGLYGEDDEEDVLHLFLKHRKLFIGTREHSRNYFLLALTGTTFQYGHKNMMQQKKKQGCVCVSVMSVSFVVF